MTPKKCSSKSCFNYTSCSNKSWFILCGIHWGCLHTDPRSEWHCSCPRALGWMWMLLQKTAIKKTKHNLCSI